MDLKKAILQEHSKKQCDRIVNYIGNDARRFAELMKLFFEGEYRVTQRAAWPMSYCVQNYPGLIKPYFKKLLTYLSKPDLHPAIARNAIRLLQVVEIPEQFHGKVMNICFNYIQDIETPVAIKAFSLTTLEQLSKKYPDILPELKLIIEERWDYESVAFKTRARKILNR